MDYSPIKNKHNPLYGLSYDQVKESIKDNPFNLKYVHNKTEELCKIAVSKECDALMCCKVKTLELCLLAVKNKDFHLDVLMFIPDEFIEECLTFVDKTWFEENDLDAPLIAK